MQYEHHPSCTAGANSDFGWAEALSLGSHAIPRRREMENPGAWNRATKIIAHALAEAEKYREDFGYSTARQVHDALEKEGLLVHESPDEPKV
jgi:hypothetical protein